jgi:citrate synthase
MFSKSRRWRTAISDLDAQGTPRLRGYSLSELAAADDVPFSDLLFLTATGELPNPGQSRMLKMMLGVTVAQGVSLTGAATRCAAAAGVPTQAAICAGLMTIGDDVGGAGEELARELQEALPLPHAGALSPADVEDFSRTCAASLHQRMMERHGHVLGLGHPLHREGDPRASLLLQHAAANGLDGPYVAALRQLEVRVAQAKGRRIPINIDGADAALLCELGMPWPYARSIIMLSRMVGLSGIAAECALEGAEVPQGLLDYDYDGPAARALPSGS